MMKVLEDAREGVRSFGYRKKGVNSYFAERGAGRGVIKALTTVLTRIGTLIIESFWVATQVLMP